MQTVRRVYVYFMAAVSLGTLAAGLIELLRLAFDQVGVALGARLLVSEPGGVRQEVSLYAALVVVALPLWLVHWWLAERSVLRAGPEAVDERRSMVRALYLSVALGLPFAFWVIALVQLIERGVLEASGFPLVGAQTISGSLSALIVAGAVWGYHGRVRLRDADAGQLDGSAAWLPRLYLYAAAFTGAMLLLFGSADLLRLIVDAIFGPGAVIASGHWWAPPLATGASRAAAGLLVWAAHWAYSLRLLDAPDWRGPSERAARLRPLYLYLGAIVGIGMTLRGVSDTLTTLLRALLGVSTTAGAAALARGALAPLLAAVPFALFWLYQQQRALDEAREYGAAPQQASMRRLSTYAVALIGLAFTGVGLAYVLGLLIDLGLGGTRTVSAAPDWWRGQVSQFTAVALAGAVAWLWQWYAAQRALAADPPAEQAATTRRVYLYIVLAATLVAILTSLAVVIYRVLTVILGASSSSTLISNVSAALGVVIVAAALAVYHGAVLRRDLPVRPLVAAAAENALELVMTGPPDADLAAELEDLRRHLPTGFSLRLTRAHR